jgi:hypothetical protein
MANHSRAHFFDCAPLVRNPENKFAQRFQGQSQIVKIPHGYVERWVDNQGNVVYHQLRKKGEPPKQETVDISRALARRMGWFEWARCPIGAGGALSVDEFPDELRTPCKAHELPGKGAEHACRHVEHLIIERRAEWAIKYGERIRAMTAAKVAKDELEAKKLAQQAELNSRLAQLVEAALSQHTAPVEPSASPAPTPDRTQQSKAK